MHVLPSRRSVDFSSAFSLSIAFCTIVAFFIELHSRSVLQTKSQQKMSINTHPALLEASSLAEMSHVLRVIIVVASEFDTLHRLARQSSSLHTG